MTPFTHSTMFKNFADQQYENFDARTDFILNNMF